MSLASFALRVATVQALSGVTLAGANVFDSPVDPSDVASKASAPTIFVFSDYEFIDKFEVRNLLEGHRTVDLSLLIVLPANFSATVNGASISFNDRNSGAAAAIDIIYRQVEQALLDEHNPWSQLWSQIVVGIKEVEAHAYVLPISKALHLPARAIRICVETLDSPVPGEPPSYIWANLIGLMTANPDLAPLAALFAATIEGNALPKWRVDAMELGDTVADAQLLGEAPLGGGPTDDVVPIQEVTLVDPAPQYPEPPLVIDAGVPTSFGV